MENPNCNHVSANDKNEINTLLPARITTSGMITARVLLYQLNYLHHLAVTLGIAGSWAEVEE